MTYYACDRCGEIISEDDLPTYEEDFGYDTGVGFLHAWQTITGECHCGGQYVEAEDCEVCGEPTAPDDLEDGICPYCRNEILENEEAKE